MRLISISSTISILACKPDEFWSIYEGACETSTLANEVTTTVLKNCEKSLRAASGHDSYELDGLLHSMLTEAPHPDGRRYVSVALRISYSKGEGVVVELAKAWMESLFLPSACDHLNCVLYIN